MKESKKGQFIALVKGEAVSQEAYNEMSNLCTSRPDDISFGNWVKQTDWSKDAIVALFRYQCLMLNGDIDWTEFEELFSVFKSKIYKLFE